MLSYQTDSPIRVRDKKETAVWITLICVMAVLLCVAILMPRLFVPGGLFGPPEGGAWWAYGETEPILGSVIGKGIVRFVSDTQWEMEVMDDCMYGPKCLTLKTEPSSTPRMSGYAGRTEA